MSQCWLAHSRALLQIHLGAGAFQLIQGLDSGIFPWRRDGSAAQSCPVAQRVTGWEGGREEQREGCQDPARAHRDARLPRAVREGAAAVALLEGSRTGTHPACSFRTGSAAPEGISVLRDAGEAAQTFSSFLREKGRLGNPKAPALHDSLVSTQEGGKEVGRELLPVQTPAWLFSVFIQLLYKSQQETICSGGWQLGQGGSLAPAGRWAPSPLPVAPAHCNLLLRGGFKQLKTEAAREEPGLSAPRRPASKTAITTSHYTHGAISEW